MNEIWRDIKEYNGKYQVSNLGNVRRIYEKKQSKMLSTNISGNGYLRVFLYNEDKTRNVVFVHKLVAKAFIPNPHGYTVVNHKDENKTNNRVDNLEWCTQSYNVRYSLDRHEKRREQCMKNILNKNGSSLSWWYKKGNAHTRTERVNQYTYEGEFIKTHNTASSAAIEVKTTNSGHILDACDRNARTDRVRKRKHKAGSGGFVWEYAK